MAGRLYLWVIFSIILLLLFGRKYRRRKKRLNDLTLTGYKTILYIITWKYTHISVIFLTILQPRHPCTIFLPIYRSNKFSYDRSRRETKSNASAYSLNSFNISNSLLPILPDWVLEKPHMVCPPKSIKKKELLGSGQYGTVHKGFYIHGNAM